MIKLISLCIVASLFFGCSSQDVQSPKDKKADLYYQHGTSKLVSKDYTGALKHLILANKFRKNDSKILNNLAMAYFFKDQLSKAKKLFKKAIAADPKNSDARNNLGSLYFRTKEFELAKKQYITVSKDLIYPHQYRIYYNLAKIAILRNKTFQAVSLLEKSLSDRHDYCPAHFELGKIASANYSYKKALSNFKEATKGTCIDLPAPHYNQALTLEKMRNFPQAKIKYNEVIEKFPRSQYSTLSTMKLRKLQSSSYRSEQSNLSVQKELKKKIQSYNSPKF
jgi:Flp pilus assembly protein TadD